MEVCDCELGYESRGQRPKVIGVEGRQQVALFAETLFSTTEFVQRSDKVFNAYVMVSQHRSETKHKIHHRLNCV